jgi:uncharacterized protein YukE
MSDIDVSTNAIEAAAMRFTAAPADITNTQGNLQGGFNSAEVAFECNGTLTGPFSQLWSGWSGALDRLGVQMKATGVLLGLAAKAYEDAEQVCVNSWVPSNAAPPPPFVGPLPPPPPAAPVYGPFVPPGP